MNAAPVTEAHKAVSVIPWSQELADDCAGIDLGHYARVALWEMIATHDGRLVKRGGGWYRLDGNTVRGHARVWALLDAEVNA